MEITITWPLALLVLASITVIYFAVREDNETRGMFQGCMTIAGIAFVIVLWIIYGGIYWW